MKKNTLFTLFTLFLVTSFFAATRFVSSSGNDTTGDGSEGNPYLTINQAMSLTANGDIIRIIGKSKTSIRCGYIVDYRSKVVKY